MGVKIEHNFRYVIIGLLLFCGSCLLSPAKSRVFAEDKTVIFDKDATYDIYYEVSKFEVNYVENVKVLGTVTINGIYFLMIRYPGIKPQDGYVLLNSIKAILPADALSPGRTSDIKKW